MTTFDDDDTNRHQKAISDLEAEMKLLHWHKLANESALRAALLRTKQMRTADRRKDTTTPTGESRKEWTARIIADEKSKPLEVDRRFIEDYQRDERRAETSLREETERRLVTLRKARERLERRDTARERKKECDRIRKLMAEERRRFDGATTGVEERRVRLPSLRQRQQEDPYQAPSELRRGVLYDDADDRRVDDDNDGLPTVLKSLDQLVALEHRIRHLEDNNLAGDNDRGPLTVATAPARTTRRVVTTPATRNYRAEKGGSRLLLPPNSTSSSSGVAIGGGGNNRRTSLAFSKRRTEPRPGQPSRPYYAVRVTIKKKTRIPLGDNDAMTGGGSGMERRRLRRTRQQQRPPNTRIMDHRSSVEARLQHARTFLTELSSAGGGREAPSRRNRRCRRYGKENDDRDNNDNCARAATVGGKADGGGRGSRRIATASSSGAGQSVKKRSESSLSRSRTAPPKIKVRLTKRGSYLGVKTNNARLRDFHQSKDDFAKRKDAIRKHTATVLNATRDKHHHPQRRRTNNTATGRAGTATNATRSRTRTRLLPSPITTTRKPNAAHHVSTTTSATPSSSPSSSSRQKLQATERLRRRSSVVRDATASSSSSTILPRVTTNTTRFNTNSRRRLRIVPTKAGALTSSSVIRTAPVVLVGRNNTAGLASRREGKNSRRHCW